MKTIDNFNLRGKKALIRVDFNVPLNEQLEITDATRINAAVPTIQGILKQGGAAILMSHLGRPKNGPEEVFSLRQMIPTLSEKLGLEVKFADDCMSENTVRMAADLKAGEVLLLENLRFYKEEAKGDEDFAKKLAQLGDVYVNDAFGTAHRAHASTSVIAKYFKETMFGYLMSNELMNINKVLVDTQRPFTAILGGAKVSGKIQIIEHMMDKVDNLIIGGGMMFTFIKAMGGNVGSSLVENDLLDLAKETIKKAKELGVNLYIPTDAILADKFDNEAQRKESKAGEIEDGWMGLDIGSETMKQFEEVVMNSKTILWNGPMGVFEMSNFEAGTKNIALAVAKATREGAYSLIGGGDSVAAINKYDLVNEVSYVSTGGGAMLEYIEGKTLPGVAAIVE
ncbi:MAG: phosphoglycerate kinase [Bacteroidales bacterium]|nr:phosphoglycerate kinase [Bacteroidales bacterium]